jgi:uncharacterized protein YdaU (DUF1376 family)
MVDFSELSPGERAAKYRQIAQDARREAANTHLSLQDSYRILAERWENLALSAESEAQREKNSFS